MQSEQINELATALSKAQAEIRNAENECILVPKIANIFHPHKRYINDKTISLKSRFLSKVSFGSTDCWYWKGCKDDSGYGRMGVKLLNENFAHRISWHLFYGKIPLNKKVLHKCDIRNCVNPEHLFLGNQTDNMRDMIKKGRGKVIPKPGESNPRHKLKNEQVIDIRKTFYLEKWTYKRMAKKYNVAPMTIHRIINFKTWRCNENI